MAKLSQEMTNNIDEIGCSRASFCVGLPLTFSQIMLLRGLAYTNVNTQTGPNYEVAGEATVTVETGPEGTRISFLDSNGGGAGEIAFTDVGYRSPTRHFIEFTGSIGPGDFSTVRPGHQATLEISDAGFRLIGHDGDVNRKYNSRSHYYYRNAHGASDRGNSTFGFSAYGPGQMQMGFSYRENHIYGWNDGMNRTTVIPFFGGNVQPRIEPQIEAMIGYDNLKKAVYAAGGRTGSEGALYWGIDADTNRIYTTGYTKDGTNSGEPKLWRGTIYTAGAQRFGAATIPYRPFGDAIRNRYKGASDAGFGIDKYGRPYVVIKWGWGYARYTTVSFNHGIMRRSMLPDKGSKATKVESSDFIPAWELSFELDPLSEHDREVVKKWYTTWQQAEGSTVQMPRVPRKGELYTWWMSYVCNADEDITEEEAILAQSLLE